MNVGALPQRLKALVRYWPVWAGIALAVSVVLVGSGTQASSHRPAKRLPNTNVTKVSNVVSVAASGCATNQAGKLLLVSISQQHVWACDGTVLANQSMVTTGASGLANVDDATPTGTWHITHKYTNVNLRGSDANGPWDDAVAYWMPFDGSVGFHDASWQTFPFGSNAYTTRGSHGCVHLPLAMAAWLYAWAPVGTTVTVKA